MKGPRRMRIIPCPHVSHSCVNYGTIETKNSKKVLSKTLIPHYPIWNSVDQISTASSSQFSYSLIKKHVYDAVRCSKIDGNKESNIDLESSNIDLLPFNEREMNEEMALPKISRRELYKCEAGSYSSR